MNTQRPKMERPSPRAPAEESPESPSAPFGFGLYALTHRGPYWWVAGCAVGAVVDLPEGVIATSSLVGS